MATLNFSVNTDEQAILQSEAKQVVATLATLIPSQKMPTKVVDHLDEVIEGTVFVALKGSHFDARVHWQEALAKGAVAVLLDSTDGYRLPINAQKIEAPVLAIPHLAKMVGYLADILFHFPSQNMKVLSVTGTNGKTSIAWALANLISALGKTCGMLGTLGYGVMGKNIALTTTGMTTPSSVKVQGVLADFITAGCDYCAVEVTSIALHQGRSAGTRFYSAIFTNLTQDHLDYHASLEDYFACKTLLFTQYPLTHAIINIDDDYGFRLWQAGQNGKLQAQSVWGVATPSRYAKLSKAEQSKIFWVEGEHPSNFTIHIPASVGSHETLLCIQTRWIGAHNIENLSLVVINALLAGFEASAIALAMAEIDMPVGRLEKVATPHDSSLPSIVVDYAHTPDALQKALKAMRYEIHHSGGGGKLWCVFGCGGNRDKSKRPQMGAIAKNLADKVIATSDNPRYEKPRDILANIYPEGESEQVKMMEDRDLAIRYAINQAKAQDWILIAGKGHEDYQEIEGVRRPFSDQEVAKKTLQTLIVEANKTTPMNTLLSTIAKDCGGVLKGEDKNIAGLFTDSRNAILLHHPLIFVALKGENFDAHHFVAEILKKGASAAMVSQDFAKAHPHLSPLIVVEDTALALLQWGKNWSKAWRKNTANRLIAITGSSGKTSTKEMVASVLRAHAGADEVHATTGNLNNSVGLPITLLGLRDYHRYAVVEVGINQVGEMALLAEGLSPNIALITNAGHAHLAGLGSIEGVAKEKGVLYRHLADDGVAVIGEDSPFYHQWVGDAQWHKPQVFIHAFSAKTSTSKVDSIGQTITTRYADKPIQVFLPTLGDHQRQNAVAALAISEVLGVEERAVKEGLAHFRNAHGRMEIINLPQLMIIDDTYNANPDSMRYAVDTLADIASPRWLALGDMKETGEQTILLHAALQQYAVDRGIDDIVVMGENHRAAYATLSATTQEKVHCLKTHTEIVTWLQAKTDTAWQKPTVLIKGSRSTTMEWIVEALVAHYAKSCNSLSSQSMEH